MSTIATARKLAAEIAKIEAGLDVPQAAELALDCQLGLPLAHLLDGGFVSRVEDKALDLLENTLSRAKALAANPALVDAKEEPIFSVGTLVVVRNKHWWHNMPAEKCMVQGVEWDDESDAFRYLFANASFTFEVMEGDLDWDVHEFCADEI